MTGFEFMTVGIIVIVLTGWAMLMWGMEREHKQEDGTMRKVGGNDEGDRRGVRSNAQRSIGLLTDDERAALLKFYAKRQGERMKYLERTEREASGGSRAWRAVEWTVAIVLVTLAVWKLAEIVVWALWRG